MSEQGGFWHRIWSSILRSLNTWPGDDMTPEQRREEFARVSREFAEERARREHRPPPWAVDLSGRLDRIEKRLDRWEQFGKPTTKEWP